MNIQSINNQNNNIFQGKSLYKITEKNISDIKSFIESNMTGQEFSNISGYDQSKISRLVKQIYGKSVAQIRFDNLFSKYASEVTDLAKQGFTLTEIREKLGLSFRQIQAIIARNKKKTL